MNPQAPLEFEVVRFEASFDGATWVEIPDPADELRALDEGAN